MLRTVSLPHHPPLASLTMVKGRSTVLPGDIALGFPRKTLKPITQKVSFSFKYRLLNFKPNYTMCVYNESCHDVTVNHS